jgi:hypothetical protein
MNCRPGDLAVVIKAMNKQNLGRIVHVIEEHDGSGDLVLDATVLGHIWLVEAARPLVWRRAGKRLRRRRGPAPDAYLMPVGRATPVSNAPATSDISTSAGGYLAEQQLLPVAQESQGALWHP